MIGVPVIAASPGLGNGLAPALASSLYRNGFLSPRQAPIVADIRPEAPSMAAVAESGLSAAAAPVGPAPSLVPGPIAEDRLAALAAPAKTASSYEAGTAAPLQTVIGRAARSLAARLGRLAAEAIFDDSKKAETADGKGKAIPKGLSRKWIAHEIKLSRQEDAKVLALQKRVQKEGFKKAALNPEVMARHNTDYTTELPVGRVTNQWHSGRCWIFAALNMVRDMLVAKGKVSKSFEFSANYLYFFSQLERANTHLENVIDALNEKGAARKPLKAMGELSPDIGDGGGMEHVQFLISKYGMVPKRAMPETKSSKSTILLDSDLDYGLGKIMRELQADARAGGRRMAQIKQRGMEQIWKILSAHLGIPPTRFNHGGRSYTPKQFTSQFVKFNPRDYVVVASIPHRKFGAVYEEADSVLGSDAKEKRPYNWRYLNVDIDQLEGLAVKAIQAGQPVYFRAPVGHDVDAKTGIMHPQIYDRSSVYDFGADAQLRLSRAKEFALNLERGGHLMVFTGFDRPDPDKPVIKFKVENSWGKTVGTKGVFHMYREWFRQYVTYIAIPRRLLDKAGRKAWDGKAKPEPE